MGIRNTKPSLVITMLESTFILPGGLRKQNLLTLILIQSRMSKFRNHISRKKPDNFLK